MEGAPRSTVSELLRTRLASWVLLVAFVVDVFVVSPLLGMGIVPRWAGIVGTTVTLVAAAVALRGRHGLRGFLLAVVAFAVVAHWGRLVTGPHRAALLQAFAVAISSGVFAVLFLVDVFRAGRLPSRLLSVLFAYLFLGAAFGGVYQFAEILHPGSFSLPGATHPGSQFLYFSFVTLSTVGYGDVLPVGPLVRSLAVLEALAGQLYLVLVVSRFVGERIVDARAADHLPGRASGPAD